MQNRSTTAAPTTRSARIREKADRKNTKKKPMPWDERRAQLLEIAEDIIANEGIAALSMSLVAERSGASKPVVYEHFDNREELALQLMAESYERISKYVAEQLQECETLSDYMDKVVESIYEIQLKYKYHGRNIVNGFSSSSEVNKLYKAQKANTHAIIVDLLKQQNLPEPDCNVAAYALMVMIIETVAEYVGNKNAANVPVLQRMVRAAVQGLLPDQQSRPEMPSAVLAPIQRQSNGLSAKLTR